MNEEELYKLTVKSYHAKAAGLRRSGYLTMLFGLLALAAFVPLVRRPLPHACHREVTSVDAGGGYHYVLIDDGLTTVGEAWVLADLGLLLLGSLLTFHGASIVIESSTKAGSAEVEAYLDVHATEDVVEETEQA
jgi:hypothetical protein